MKKNYVAHSMNIETFTANEYCSTCGEENRVYKFVCDAYGWAYGLDITGSTVYLNGPDGEPETSDDITLGSYKLCKITHDAPMDDEFEAGYLKKNILGYPAGERKDVIVWTDNGTNIHCTTKVNMDSWITAKS